MTRNGLSKRFVTGFLLLMTSLFVATVCAQTTEIKGLIKGRSGPTMILETPENKTLTVMLTDKTEVGQMQGVFKARRKEMSMAALIPGLAVEIEAVPDVNNQLIAKKVKFKGDDLKKARAINAGLTETSAQAKRNAEDIKKSQEDLEQQKAALQAQQEALQHQQKQVAAQQEKITENQQNIAQNRAAIEASIARFGQLDDYYILDEVTVLFPNGKSNIDPKYNTPLLQLAEKAKTFPGYIIEVKGYASAVGNEALNQKLSEDRAENVANFLLQKAHVPLTNLLSPAAMGESQQVSDNKTAEGQAENRRVVVRVLQNKGIAGLSLKGD
jgi:OmpA-OmpF porin, OOP family